MAGEAGGRARVTITVNAPGVGRGGGGWGGSGVINVCRSGEMCAKSAHAIQCVNAIIAVQYRT